MRLFFSRLLATLFWSHEFFPLPSSPFPLHHQPLLLLLLLLLLLRL
jgi:hypothetical protein